MMEVSRALEIVLEHARPASPRMLPLGPKLLGRVLAEDVASDLDMPPFDKALMDGYAVRASDLPSGRGELPVFAEVSAGEVAPALPSASAIRIMTGAPIPDGADVVVRVEHSRMVDAERVLIATEPPKPGQFIMRRGAEMKQGDVVIQAGTVLQPSMIGLLASVGQGEVPIIPKVDVAVLATGDELVDAQEKPGPSQLRNSNGPMLSAQSARAGGEPVPLGVARDHPEDLRSKIAEGLKFPVLVLAGGVSAGKRDLVPEMLKSLDVTAHIYQIAMKPGKPFFFGTRGTTLIFGLPGNPVSSYCCFELFVRPAIRRLAGHSDPEPDWQTALLDDEFRHRSDRPTYHPAVIRSVDGVIRVRPTAWLGSPDLRGLSAANALVRLPPGEHRFEPNSPLPVLRIDA
jgi:molybdopterin molybdotransferase